MITQGIVKKILAYPPRAIRSEQRYRYSDWKKICNYYGRNLKNVLGALAKPDLEELYSDLVKIYGKR